MCELEDLREVFQQQLKDGLFCPVCDRWGKIYKRPLNATMVRTLAWLWRLSARGEHWVDVPKEARNGAKTYDYTKQYSTLKHWGFLRHKKNLDKPKQKESGVWKPTQQVGFFLRGLIDVPKYAFTYNDSLRGFSKERASVRDIVEGFNYVELMRTDGEVKEIRSA